MSGGIDDLIKHIKKVQSLNGTINSAGYTLDQTFKMLPRVSSDGVNMHKEFATQNNYAQTRLNSSRAGVINSETYIITASTNQIRALGQYEKVNEDYIRSHQDVARRMQQDADFNLSDKDVDALKHIDKLQRNAEKNGNISPKEQHKIDKAIDDFGRARYEKIYGIQQDVEQYNNLTANQSQLTHNLILDLQEAMKYAPNSPERGRLMSNVMADIKGLTDETGVIYLGEEARQFYPAKVPATSRYNQNTPPPPPLVFEKGPQEILVTISSKLQPRWAGSTAVSGTEADALALAANSGYTSSTPGTKSTANPGTTPGAAPGTTPTGVAPGTTPNGVTTANLTPEQQKQFADLQKQQNDLKQQQEELLRQQEETYQKQNEFYKKEQLAARKRQEEAAAIKLDVPVGAAIAGEAAVKGQIPAIAANQVSSLQEVLASLATDGKHPAAAALAERLKQHPNQVGHFGKLTKAALEEAGKDAGLAEADVAKLDFTKPESVKDFLDKINPKKLPAFELKELPRAAAPSANVDEPGYVNITEDKAKDLIKAVRDYVPALKDLSDQAVIVQLEKAYAQDARVVQDGKFSANELALLANALHHVDQTKLDDAHKVLLADLLNKKLPPVLAQMHLVADANGHYDVKAVQAAQPSEAPNGLDKLTSGQTLALQLELNKDGLLAAGEMGNWGPVQIEALRKKLQKINDAFEHGAIDGTGRPHFDIEAFLKDPTAVAQQMGNHGTGHVPVGYSQPMIDTLLHKNDTVKWDEQQPVFAGHAAETVDNKVFAKIMKDMNIKTPFGGIPSQEDLFVGLKMQTQIDFDLNGDKKFQYGEVVNVLNSEMAQEKINAIKDWDKFAQLLKDNGIGKKDDKYVVIEADGTAMQNVGTQAKDHNVVKGS